MALRLRLPLLAVLLSIAMISSTVAFGNTSSWDLASDVIVSSGNEASQQRESHLDVNEENNNQVVAALMDNNSGLNRCRAYSSSNGAQTWSDRGFLPLSSGTDSSADPVVSSDSSGTLFIACIARDVPDNSPSDILYYVSTNGGSSWSGPNTVVTSTSPIFHDKPWMAADTLDLSSPYRDNVYVCWTKYDDPVGTQKRMFRKIWPSAGSIKQVATGNSGTEHPGTGEVHFCQVTVGESGIIYVTWQRLSSPTNAKIQLKRSFDGGNSFEMFTQTAITFTRLPYASGNNCPTLEQNLWGCLPGELGTGIETPAIHATAIDSINWRVHLAYMTYDFSTFSDIRYTQGTSCTTSGVACTWATSQKIVKDGNISADQFSPGITISSKSDTIHVIALDRRNGVNNVEWQPFHYHCHLASASCTSQANWQVTNISNQLSSNFDGDAFIGHYHGITSSDSREADSTWTDTRNYLFNQDYNIFGDRLIS